MTIRRPRIILAAAAVSLLAVANLPAEGAIAARLVDGKTLKARSVTAAKLANNSVTPRALAKRAVTAAKLAPGAIGTAALAKGAVTAAKLAPGAVGSAALANGSVTAASLAPGAVTAASVAPGTLDASAFSSKALAEINPPSATAGSVGTSALANGAVTASKLADGSVSGSKVAMQIVTADGSAPLASIASATASCPPGTRAFSGGVTIDDASTVIPISALRQSAPVADANGMPVGWVGTVANTANLGGAFTFHVLAICG